METSPLLIAFFAVVSLATLALVGVAVWVFFRFRSTLDSVAQTREEIARQFQDGHVKTLEQAQQQMHQMSERLQGMQNALNERLDNQRQLLSQQLTDSGKTVADLREQLGSLSEATTKLFDLGKDIASLEDILKSPKLRGGVGEIFLENLLAAILPSALFDLQHTFASGERVDAVVQIGDRLVPVDAKFPIEDFRKVLEAEEADRPKARRQFLANVRRKVDDIAAKYILPDEGTYDFALMYIPAENVYYEAILRDEKSDSSDPMEGLLGYAVERRVIPVSPNSFFAYLQVIIFGLKGMELERRGHEILSHLRRLDVDLNKFQDEFGTLGTHLSHARGSFDRAEKRLEGFEAKLRSLETDAETPKSLSE